MMCFIPAASDGAPHAAHGMIKVFDVKGAKSRAKPPTTQATVTLNDDGIDFPLDNPGRNLSLKITNAGTTPHSFTLVKINGGEDPRRREDLLRRLLQRARTRRATRRRPSSAAWQRSRRARAATSQQTLTAGHYGYVSTEGDDPANDDSTRGLIGEFTVK